MSVAVMYMGVASIVSPTGVENATLNIIFLLLLSGADLDNVLETAKLNALEEADFQRPLDNEIPTAMVCWTRRCCVTDFSAFTSEDKRYET